VDASAAAGIDYELGHGGRTPLSILEVAPGGCAFADLDGDGWQDIILAGPPRCAAYRNLGDGRFADVSRAWKLDRYRGDWMGCTIGDYDNDGAPDLLLTGYRCGALLRNEGARGFTDVTRTAGLKFDLWTTSAGFADLDGDGWLDLYVGAYVAYHRGGRDHCRRGQRLTACGPEAYEPERGYLYRNRGDGRFEDRTASSGLASCAGKTWGVAFADYNDDGRTDLYVANDQMPGNLYRNLGGWRFRDVGVASGTAYDAKGQVQGGMGVDWADFNGDGRLDLFVATYVRQIKELYKNEGGDLFLPVGSDVGLAQPALPYVTFGCGFFDANNDGVLDLLLTNGHVQDNAAILDASQSYPQPLQFFLGQPGGRFADVTATAGAPFATPMVGRGMAFSDYDRDGAVDALVVDLEGRARLLRNQAGDQHGHWLTVQLDGGRRNSEGLGARVTVESGGRPQVREVTRTRSVLSASDPQAHFGLGGALQADRIRVRWPASHTEEWLAVKGDQSITLRKGSGRRIPSSPLAK
jgi:hypothetical protein